MEEIFGCKPKITYNDYLKSKEITWEYVGGRDDINVIRIPDCFASRINNFNWYTSFRFSFKFSDNRPYLIVKYYLEEYKLKIDDSLIFNFEDETNLTFIVNKEPFITGKTYDSYKNKFTILYECEFPITMNELFYFSDKKFKSWILDLRGNKLYGGDDWSAKKSEWNKIEYFQIAIKICAKKFIELIKSEIPDYKEQDSIPTNNDCYVYLMKDFVNNLYKIGISNNPEYRERTLQSEKPTIELIIAKNFPKRTIAELMEKTLHSNYNNKRIRGEWFILSDEDIKDISYILK